jgi:hypothetical protein
MLPPTVTALLQTMHDKAVKAEFSAPGTASALDNIDGAMLTQ